MHIGLIGGIGPAATEFYYRGLVRARSSSARPLELTIAHANMDVLLSNLAAGAPDAQAQVFLHHAQQLKGAGAEVLAVTSIAGHFCIVELEAISPLPLVNALGTVREELERRGLRRIGLLGSQAAMETGLYGALSEFDLVLPSSDDLPRVGQEYLAMARAQRAQESQRELFFRVGADLYSQQEAQVVVLAGTDMFLAFGDSDPGFEVIDSADVHIESLARLA